MQDAPIESIPGSDQFARLLEARRNAFKKGASEATYGFSHPLYHHVGRIERLVQITSAKRILDYGATGGNEYDARVIELPGETGKRTVVDFWGVDVVHCYDPGNSTFCDTPRSSFDAVVCLNLLEFCPASDASRIVKEMFALADKFVFIAVASDGPHPRASQAWLDIVASASSVFPKVIWETWVMEAGPSPRAETRLANFNWNN